MTDNTMAERKQCTKLKDKQQSTIHYTMYIYTEYYRLSSTTNKGMNSCAP